MKISVVIPAYNESGTIEEIVQRVKEVSLDKEIIVVDDGSTDGTKEKLQKLQGQGIKVFYHEKNPLATLEIVFTSSSVNSGYMGRERISSHANSAAGKSPFL